METKGIAETSDDAAKAFTSEIKRANMHELMFIIIPDLSGIIMTDVVREYFVKLVGARLKTLTGEYQKIATVRAMVAWSGEPLEPTPEWCKKWVFIKHRRRYFNMESKEEYTRPAFNRINNHRVSKEVLKEVRGINRIALKNDWIRCVDSYAYLPNDDAFVTLESGLEVLNTFDPATVPIAANEYTEAGLDAIDRVKECIYFIAGTPERADALTQWLAHQVQRPGEIVGWSPLIASKIMDREFLPRLLANVLGYQNVGVQTSAQLRTKMHNGWANEKALMVFYELRGTAYYPQEVIDNIASYIIKDDVRIHARGSQPLIVPNTTNYLAFTRYFHICQADRCWWVVSTSPEALKVYKKVVGDDSGKYYGSLNYAVECRKAEVRKWLLEYEIDDDLYGLPEFNSLLNDL